MEEIKDINKWKHTPSSWTRRFNVVKTSLLSKATYRTSAIPIKIPTMPFAEIEKNTLLNASGTSRDAKWPNNLEKEE